MSTTSSALKTMTYSRSLAITAALILGIGCNQGAKAQHDKSMVYFDAPAPEALAEILFPPRYRGTAAATDDAYEDKKFSMMINFNFDSTLITPESEAMLASVGEMLGMESAQNESIVIEGHTDAVGSDAYNQGLSESRARAIKEHLVAQFGIAPRRLKTVGKGERQLHVADQPDASINRRVTFRPARKLVLK